MAPQVLLHPDARTTRRLTSVATTSLAQPAHDSRSETHNARAERALQIYRTRGREIRRAGEDLYLVPSCTGQGFYCVEYGEREACDCPDRAYHPELPCKHILCVGVAHAKRRGATARRLAALEERYRHEDLDIGERMELRASIVRLRRKRSLGVSY